MVSEVESLPYREPLTSQLIGTEPCSDFNLFLLAGKKYRYDGWLLVWGVASEVNNDLDRQKMDWRGKHALET